MKQINLGVIGTGNMALQHLKVITKIKNFNPYGITSKTNKNSKLILNVAFNYGSDKELVNIIKGIVNNNKTNLNKIDYEFIKKFTYLKDIPNPDILIRTG